VSSQSCRKGSDEGGRQGCEKKAVAMAISRAVKTAAAAAGGIREKVLMMTPGRTTVKTVLRVAGRTEEKDSEDEGRKNGITGSEDDDRKKTGEQEVITDWIIVSYYDGRQSSMCKRQSG
jgi:hypothetical protein